MRRFLLLVMVCMALAISGNAQATSIIYSETYVLPNQGLYLNGKTTIEIGFNLTGPGDSVKNGNTVIMSAPTIDVTSYNPNTQTILSGTLNFQFGDKDYKVGDHVQVRTSIYDGSQMIYNKVLQLGSQGNGFQSLTASIDLADVNLLNYLQDGKFITLVIEPDSGSNDNFYLQYANLTASATEPVPEPATLFLVGTGLVGLGSALRRKLIG